MDLAKISLEQVFIMFIMIFLGFLLVKLKLIDIQSKKTLSNILVYLVVPFMIVNSYITSEFNSERAANIGFAFLASFILLVVGIIIAFVAGIFYKTDDKPVLKFGLMFSNAAYMGFPLIEAMFGSDGLIYASCFVSVFNILLWTIGYMTVSKNFNVKEAAIAILKTPVIYSLVIGLILFFTKSSLPNVISKPLSMIGSMNTPLSMIITGMIIASSNIKGVLKNKYLWIETVLRLILIPLICLPVVFLLKQCGMDKEVLQIVFILEACPVAAITSVFAIKFNYNEDLAGSCVVITTLLSIITLPLFTLLITNIL